MAEEEPNINKITRAFEIDVNMSFKLLKYAQSSLFNRTQQEISNIKQAIVAIGLQELRRFVSLMFTAQFKTDKPHELTVMSLTRARFCESIAALPGQKVDKSSAFLVGLLSLLDAMLDASIEELLDKLPLSEAIKTALIKGEGLMADYINLVRRYEKAEWEEAYFISMKINADSDRTANSFVEAQTWATERAEFSNYKLEFFRRNMSSQIPSLTHLRQLEAESIHIFREVAAEFENPVMLYSVGKDSSVLLHLARKAFAPGKIPFPLMHVNTTWKFREMIEFRDKMAEKYGFELISYTNPEGADNKITPFTHGSAKYTDIMKTQALKQALDKYQFDAAFGGARRDEEKSRAKERVFSFRDKNHRWDPKNQRPELWNIYNAQINKGESIRVFPMSNWTELDIWQYIYMENIEIPSLYLAKPRP
ncbi:hypothetical protein TRIADDRAFT_62932, partial [Trichoplax adhaerens]